MLAYTYVAIGWWASLICALLVLAVWQSHDAREIARHDAMTGLLNRAGSTTDWPYAIDAAQRSGRLSALLAIDLDGFKAINDSHGHAVGDEVIRVVGDRLQTSIRLTDAAVRRGGDEFGLLLVNLPNAPTAVRLAKRIHATITAPDRARRPRARESARRSAIQIVERSRTSTDRQSAARPGRQADVSRQEGAARRDQHGRPDSSEASAGRRPGRGPLA